MPPIPPPRSSGFTTTTTVPLHHATWGQPGGDRLLVLHGGPGAHLDYLLPQMLELERGGHELLLYDQRGGGKSKTDDRAPIGWREHVDDLVAVIRELGVAPLSIVGYSWGAMLALLYMREVARAATPSGATLPRPARVVLIDPAPLTRAFRTQFEAEFARRQQDGRVLAMRQELAASGLRERDPEAYRHRTFELSVAGYFHDPARARDLTPFRVTGRVQQSVWESLGDFDLVSDLQSMGTPGYPVQVLHGREDPIPLASSEAAARALGAELVVLDQCGHVPYVEQPRALFDAIHRFLRDTAPLARP
jgi:proline iminopeptidase